MSDQPEPIASPPWATTSSANPPQLVPVAFLLAPIIAVGGGLAAGALIVKFGMLGGICMWAAGAAGGFVARRIMRAPCLPVAWSLVVACVLAFGLAEVSWYRWSVTLPDENGGRRDPTWAEAFTRAPIFLFQQASLGLLVGALFAGFGAHSAYLQAGKRYRLVAVED